jgi:hypothetical protein
VNEGGGRLRTERPQNNAEQGVEPPHNGIQQAASRADPRTTMRSDRGRQSLDRHATYIVATFIAGAAR